MQPPKRKSFADIKVVPSCITVIGSGNSVHQLSSEDLEFLKANTLVFTMNYAPIRVQGHINMWSDRKVTRWMADFYRENEKKGEILVRDRSFNISKKEQFPVPVDYWFNERRENIRGNYTIVWLLQLLEKHQPHKKVLVLGLDLAAPDRKQAKWYDQYTTYDREKRGASNEVRKLTACGTQLKRFLRRPGMFYNGNPDSDFDGFEKGDWKPWLLEQLKES